MTLRLAIRSLVTRPVRSAVLCCGFGFGISVMAALLGVGDVILEQARSPALRGGGDVLVSGAAGSVGSARFLIGSVLTAPPLGQRVAAVSPSTSASLFLVHGGAVTPVAARGGIPSLERALDDPETSHLAGRWRDTPDDRRWTDPEPEDLLRAMDRFHPIPDAPDWSHSWAEWLYFNGRTVDGSIRFYLTFLVGPRTAADRRGAGVRLQLERSGRITTYARRVEVGEAELLRNAPDLDFGGGNRVRLDGLRYVVTLDLLREGPSSTDEPSSEDGSGRARIAGEIVLSASPGRSIPPIAIRGAHGWVSGYTVPVLDGSLSGTLKIGSETLSLDGATGYHDHNWGFWDGVTWQWGQLSSGSLSIVYGRVHPPADAADPERVPGFIGVIESGEAIGFATDVSIVEVGGPGNSPGSAGDATQAPAEGPAPGGSAIPGGSSGPSGGSFGASGAPVGASGGSLGASEGSLGSPRRSRDASRGAERASRGSAGAPGSLDVASGRSAPHRIEVRGRGEGFDLELRAVVESTVETPLLVPSVTFLQMRALFDVHGRIQGRPIDVTARGSAETFRSRPR